MSNPVDSAVNGITRLAVTGATIGVALKVTDKTLKMINPPYRKRPKAARKKRRKR